jgi:predicted KAP-like P-loop ATPase
MLDTKYNFYSDSPIIDKEHDYINRAGFAQTLLHALINIKSSDTFTVGLFGKWGSGKTSIINLMLREAENMQEVKKASDSSNSTSENDETVFLRFEPWNFFEANQLLIQFFALLSDNLRSKKDMKLANLGEAIERYSNAFDLITMIPVVGEAVSSVAKGSALLLSEKLKNNSDEKNIMKQKEIVMELLKEQKIRFCIIIDNIDRLSNAQICLIFQLVTSVANFPNTTYLLVFDKEIVVKALEKMQEGSGEEYLEKVIQIPIQLPDTKKSDLEVVCYEKLKNIYQSYYNEELSNERFRTQYEICIRPFIKNLREMNRISNALMFKLATVTPVNIFSVTTVAPEVDFADMATIAVLEVFMPSIYTWVVKNKAILIEPEDTLSSLEKGKGGPYSFFENQLMDIIQSEDPRLLLDNTIKDVLNLIAHIFPKFGKLIRLTTSEYDEYQFRKNNKIAHISKFDRYFRLRLEDGDIAKTTLTTVIHSSPDKILEEKLISYINNGTIDNYLGELNIIIQDGLNKDKMLAISNVLYKIFFLSLDLKFEGEIKQYVLVMLIDLMSKLTEDNIEEFLANHLSEDDAATYSQLASLISEMNARNTSIERKYWGLDFTKSEEVYKVVIVIKKIFCKKCKEVLIQKKIYPIESCDIILGILEEVDIKYAMKYLNYGMNTKEGILLFVKCFTHLWKSNGVYRLNRSWLKKYSDTEPLENRFLLDIETKTRNKTLFDLPVEIQRHSIAFYLMMHNGINEVLISVAEEYLSELERNPSLLTLIENNQSEV